MLKLLDRISMEVKAAFADAGFDAADGKVTPSNRPDLCQFQCSGCLAAAKKYKTAPIRIADAVVEKLRSNPAFSCVQACMPGFINFTLSPAYLASYLTAMRSEEKFGLETESDPQTIVLDYGGPNVAKPLHIGHLRSAIIGESLKRIFRYFGNSVIGDIHMGDWGLQIGLIITELRHRQPSLPYFDPAFSGPYPQQPPFTISELEEIYPAASAKSKTDETFAAEAHAATRLLQEGDPGCKALWTHIMAVSVADLKKNYDNLNVSFDVWLGESNAEPYIEPMIAQMKAKGVAVESEGALVVPVTEPEDSKELPPCILVKSDGATLYATTDLATIVQRMQDYHPGRIFYITDKRQNLHFEQVFRAARKGALVPENVRLEHLGFGTMNGSDGKPFKTREGGVMRLEQLISDITDFVRRKVEENRTVAPEEMEHTAHLIAMAALKYGDLSNLPTKDYIFDMDRFSAFEGNTGPYILYTIVRIHSILSRCDRAEAQVILPPDTPEETELMLTLARFSDSMQLCYREASPNILCAYIYDLACAANKFYHDVRILTEPDAQKRAGYLSLICLTKDVLETSISLLGFEAPEKM